MADEGGWVESGESTATVQDGDIQLILPTGADQYEDEVGSGEKSVFFDAETDFGLNSGGATGANDSGTGFINFYAWIDWWRPYFDVEPAEVGARLLQSLVPGLSSDILGKRAADLYGPTSVVFTLILLLMFNLQSSKSTVHKDDVNLMSLAFGVCFTYWFASTLLFFFLSYAMAMEYNFLNVLSLSGYAMTGVCLCLLPTIFFDASSHSYLTLSLFGLVGCASASSLGMKLYQGAEKPQSGMVAGAASFLIHTAFIFYLFTMVTFR
mmetsp:Transcript_22688/g.63791  ORF Transcript_22688/g.63791 Transcript_22688/m.63791 type:complete len:266 (-) Transcript_22688:150-947(-)|eukprot:CAMPEP_0119150160 /NCGR_PEP_ID=MMETSP1310-20130426/44364_1 /TAXON_ID=464262 /ORGANISM="Genus nov. species nov., Strain RCC2339" /LENGTH=265 /DNA_ID=CAMNT_0007142311 /DNA_START=59 /DNA_END=856 /DNA_ORIENTATION=+